MTQLLKHTCAAPPFPSSCRRLRESVRTDSERVSSPSKRPIDLNRAVIALSMNFYQIGKSKDRELDLRGANGAATNATRARRKNYSTARGAVYPAFATTSYFTGFPFSMILTATPVCGSTNSTLILRNLPSLA